MAMTHPGRRGRRPIGVVVKVSAVPCAVSVQFCAACTVMPPVKAGPNAVVP